MTTQTTPEQAREIAQHLFFPNGDNGYALRSLAEQVETLTAERDALKDAARLALDVLENIPQADSDCDEQTQQDDDAMQEAIAALKAVL